jgi:hypothetical protein
MPGAARGMLSSDMRSFIDRLVEEWGIQEMYKMRASEAIEFQYTYWPEPENRSARTQQFVDVWFNLYSLLFPQTKLGILWFWPCVIESTTVASQDTSCLEVTANSFCLFVFKLCNLVGWLMDWTRGFHDGSFLGGW